ncbi:MAG: hypothetical protein AAFX00_08280, partial [Pseudomonadota bacterium]
GQSIFDATVASEEGYVRTDARWVYAMGEHPRHRDHTSVSTSGRPKSNRKWCIAPLGPLKDHAWLTHFVKDRSDPVDPEFMLLHCRQISTGWKMDRSKTDWLDLAVEPEISSLMAKVYG